MQLRLSQAQQLIEALGDPLLRPTLEEFCQRERLAGLNDLVQAVRTHDRDFHRESFLAGKIEVFETLMQLLEKFATEAMEKAQG
jgi:hypothetical protein